MMQPVSDRLNILLQNHECLFGIICRDPTITDIELMAQSGYHIIWLDHEHSSRSMADLLQLSRTIVHLDMVPMLRVSELSRSQIQTALDGGIQILTLPNVNTVEQAQSFVQHGKYPPEGGRGVSTTNAGAGYSLGQDTRVTLDAVNKATHLMVMIEGDDGYNNLDGILAVEGFDMLTIGPLDWATELGVFDEEARAMLAPKIESVITRSAEAGKTVAMVVLSDADMIRAYHALGARIFFVGEDIVMKRQKFEDTLRAARSALWESPGTGDR